MTWEAPRTWVTGEVVTAAHMNEQVRDNLEFLGASGTIVTRTLAVDDSGQSLTSTAFVTLLEETFNMPDGWDSFDLFAWGNFTMIHGNSASGVGYAGSILLGASAGTEYHTPNSAASQSFMPSAHPVHQLLGRTASTTSVRLRSKRIGGGNPVAAARGCSLTYMAIRRS